MTTRPRGRGVAVLTAGVLAGLLLVLPTPAAEAVPAPAAAATTAVADPADPAGEPSPVEYSEAIAAYVESAVGVQWDDDPVAVALEAAPQWDDRQRALLDPGIAALEADGWTVRIAILPGLPYYPGERFDYRLEEVGMQRALSRIEQDDPQRRTAYLLATGSSVRVSTYEDGVLRTEQSRIRSETPPYLNAEQTAPPIAFALRSLAADESGLVPLAEETAPTSWMGFQFRHHMQRDGSIGSRIATSSFVAGLVVGGLLLALCVVLLLPRRWGPLARVFGTRIDRRHEAAVLSSLRAEAVRAHRRLTTASRLRGSVETAIGRLPDPAASDSPLVWAGWAELTREQDGKHRTRCFFRPDLPADTEESVDLLGAQVLVSVSDLNAERIAQGRAPSYLSVDGIDRGRPYWTRASSPWAASGFGAFGPLSEAIAAMPADWAPAPGAKRAAQAAEWGGTFRAEDRASASPWARVALLSTAAVAALVAGTVAGVHDGAQMEKTYIAEPGAAKSAIAHPAAVLQEKADRAVAESADAPFVDPYIAPALVGEDLEAVQQVADEVAESLGRDVRVIAHGKSHELSMAGFRWEDALEDALPPGGLAVVLSGSSADILTSGLAEDYTDRPERPSYAPDRRPADEAIAQLRWAEQVTWEQDESDHGGFDGIEAFAPAPGTAAWSGRVWGRTLLGAGGAALLILVAGTVFRRTVIDRTDPAPQTGSRSGRNSKRSSNSTSSTKSRTSGSGRRRRA